MLVDVEDGKIKKVRANPDHKISQGKMCTKPTAPIEFHYHPDRLNYPLKRTSEKVEGI